MSSGEFIDIEKQLHQNHRESEGQDTITPLTNSLFLKQLSKLKSSSNRTLNSSASSSQTSLNRQSTLLGPESPSDASLKSFIPETLANLFANANVNTKSTRRLSSSRVLIDDSASFEQNFNDKTSRNTLTQIKKQKSYTKLHEQNDANDPLNKSFISNNKNSTLNLNKTDQVYDAISTIIHNPKSDILLHDRDFIENVRLIVYQTDLIKKRKVDKSIFTCRVFMFLFLIFMILLLFYFLKTINNVKHSFLMSLNQSYVSGSQKTVSLTSFSDYSSTTIQSSVFDDLNN